MPSHVTDFGRLGGIWWLYWAVEVASVAVESVVVAAVVDGEDVGLVAVR